jgi:hypothetical protein
VLSYRLFCLDEGGHICHRHDFDADSDDDAIEFARATFPENTCEIWELGRKIMVSPALKNAG